MTITNEIKAKVFAQYLGQKITCTETGMTGELIDVGFGFLVAGFPPMGPDSEHDEIEFNLNRSELRLRPLSEITDEDAIEVFRMTVTRIKYPRVDYKIIRHNTSTEVRLDNSHFSESAYIGHTGNVWTSVKHPRYGNNVFTFFSDKGYDQMHHLLWGRTLKEAGLAVYES